MVHRPKQYFLDKLNSPEYPSLFQLKLKKKKNCKGKH